MKLRVRKINNNLKRVIKKASIFIISSIVIVIILFLIGYSVLYIGSYGDEFDNYIYSSQFFKDKQVMIIVPHEDDEINVAGATIKNYTDAGSNVVVVFTTNGDYNGLGELRIDEAVNAMVELGVKKENVLFLGYGDQWDTEYGHIYNAPGNTVVKSHIGKTATYGNENISDFRTIVSEKPSEYTRNNFKNDIKDVILKYLPEVIFTVDFDSHIDHRATSLIFEESMCEILRENQGYTPQVFKGFAYNTAWYAEGDFYSANLESTIKPSSESLQNSNYELDLPNYNWRDRVRFLVPKDTLTYTKVINPIYKSLSNHGSQYAKWHSEQIINSDQVFWERSTKSITYNAKVDVSSGKGNYINDFKLADTSDISKENNVVFDKCVWIPTNEDEQKMVRIEFNEPKTVASISIYDNLSLEDNILKGKIIFSDGSEIDIVDINKNGSETVINFEDKNNIEYVEFYILEYEGENPGLCELEVFEKDKNLDIQYIKLAIDNINETFMYRYTVLGEKEVPLKIYSYPNTYSNNIWDKCRVYIVNETESLRLDNNILKINDNPKKGKYKIRVELIDNPEVFDEVEIVIPNKLQEIYLNYIEDYEKLFIRGINSLRYRLGLDQ